MKKFLATLAILVVVFGLCACGNKSSANDFSSLIRPINWTMTLDDVTEMEKQQYGKKPTSIDDYSSCVVISFSNSKLSGYSGTVIYRFTGSTLDFVKFKFNSKNDYDSYIASFTEQYGESNAKDGCWTGTVDGKKAIFAANADDITHSYMIEIDKS